MKAAKFVPCPCRIDDLMDGGEPGVWLAYHVVATVELGAVDYENFISDMLVEREFLESAAGLCSAGEIIWCIKVSQKGCSDSVLVVPRKNCFIGWAAYISEE